MKKKTIKTIVTIATIGIMLVSAYWLGTTQAKTVTKEVIPDNYTDTTTDEFYNNYIDMRQVTDFTAAENGLQIYLSDGTGYYWER